MVPGRWLLGGARRARAVGPAARVLGRPVPAAFAAVRNSAGELLLVRRIDDGNWELPGGRIEVGEFARQSVVREVAEESGISIECTGLTGVDSDPTHGLFALTTPSTNSSHSAPRVPCRPPPPTNPAPTRSRPTLLPGSTPPKSPTSQRTRRCDYGSTMPSAKHDPLLRLQQYPDLHDDELGSTGASGAKTRTI